MGSPAWLGAMGCDNPQQCSLERGGEPGSLLLLPNLLWTRGPAQPSQRSSRTTMRACRHMCPHGDTPYMTTSPS